MRFSLVVPADRSGLHSSQHSNSIAAATPSNGMLLRGKRVKASNPVIRHGHKRACRLRRSTPCCSSPAWGPWHAPPHLPDAPARPALARVTAFLIHNPPFPPHPVGWPRRCGYTSSSVRLPPYHGAASHLRHCMLLNVVLVGCCAQDKVTLVTVATGITSAAAEGASDQGLSIGAP